MISKELLETAASAGELSAFEFLEKIPRTFGNYKDFYQAAALLHAGYISTDSTTDSQGEKKRGTLGIDTKETAVFLQQLVLPKGESFEINGCPRDSAAGFPVRFFITAKGYLKLEEIIEREASKKQKRIDYAVSLLVAIIAVIVSSFLFHYFALQRTPENRIPTKSQVKHEQELLTNQSSSQPKTAGMPQSSTPN